jgi:4-hydroxybenzoate polyprenyltransferase
MRGEDQMSSKYLSPTAGGGASAPASKGGLSGAYSGLQLRWAAAGAAGEGRAGVVLAHLRLLRPTTRLWLDTIMPIAVFMVLADGSPDAATLVMFIVVMNLIHASAHIFNDLEDVEADRNSSELLRASRPLAQGSIARRTAIIEGAALAVLGVGLSFVIAPLFGVFLLALTAITLMNELPPVRVQSRTYMAQVYTTAGLACLMLALAYVVDGAKLADAAPFLLFVATYLGLGETLVKDVRDIDNDKIGGKVTTAVKYGAAVATAWSVPAYLVAAGAWAWFCFSYPGLAAWPLVLASAALAGWIGYSAFAARALAHGFSKSICVSLHRGSVLVFTTINVAAILAIAL